MTRHAPLRFDPRSHLLPLVALLACLALATSARATEGPPVSLRLVEFDQPARAGELLQLRFRVEAHEEGRLRDARFGSEGWNVSPQKLPTGMLAKGADATISVEALCVRPDEPVVVDVDWNDRTQRFHFDLSPEAHRRSQAPMPVRPISGASTTSKRDAGDLRVPGASLSADDPRAIPFDVEIVDEEGEGVAKASRNIRVHGRFAYYRTDGELLGVDGATVEIYDADNGPDQLQTTTVTDAFGNFDVTFNWDPCFLCDAQPDIVAKIRMTNTEVRLENTSGSLYSYATPTESDYTGTDLDLGTFGPADEGDYPGLHIFTNFVRTWRWLENRGYDQPQVKDVWPDGEGWGAYYTSGAQEIHVTGGSGSSEWNDNVHIHEYGHHFVHTHSAGGTLDYCNNYCDDDVSEGDCGHCLWCEETDQDAWNEGGPDWLGDTIADSFDGTYGTPAWAAYDFESLKECNSAEGVHDALITEGLFAALLIDIEDSSNDDHSEFPDWQDVLSMGTNEILTVMTVDEPQSPAAFIQDFKNRYPAFKEDLWETAANAGYEGIDTIIPTAVSSLTSSSHSIGVESPDATIRFTWNGSTDDFSGLEGYEVSITANSPGTPSQTIDLGPSAEVYVSPPLSPGSYYFNIRAVDRDGNRSSVRSTGPYDIREALPANLVYDTNPGWYDYIVPRSVADAGATYLPAPTALNGNQQSTYWNLRVQNVGETSVPCCAQVWVLADGHTFFNPFDPVDHSATISGLGPNASDNELNHGPLYLTGGRHTFGAHIDYGGVVAESDETDNRWARQWIWSPLSIIPGGNETRPAPPDRDGNWDDVSGSTLWYNCDGIRFDSSAWWNVVYVAPGDFDDDYDVRLHEASTGPTNGFASNQGYSSRGAGCLDAVIVNRNVTGATEPWDVGVIQAQGDRDLSDYRVRHVENGSLNLGTPLQTSMQAHEYLRIYEFYVSSSEAGDVVITVDLPSSAAPLYAQWLAEDFGTGDLMDYDAWGTQDADGDLQMVVNIPDSGYNALVLYRDPKNGGGASQLSYTVKVEPAPTDFRPYAASGWYAPLVPRPADDGSFSSVPQPSTLPGNVESTYMNVAAENLTTASGTEFYQTRVYVDGLFRVGYGLPSVVGNQKFTTNGSSPISVPGGRHSLAMYTDALENYAELDETNNGFGEQWIWTPLSLGLDSPVTRSQPSDRTGGWSEITTGEPLFFNCDGLRTPVFSTSGNDGRWGAVAAVASSGSDVDLRLHELSTGAKNGFGANLVSSTWGGEETELTLVNFHRTPHRAFDAGVLDVSGSGGYTVEAVRSTYLASSPAGTYSGFSLGAGEVVDLHEVFLDAGPVIIRLVNQDGEVDYGMTLHRADLAYQNRATGVSDAVSYLAEAGEDEWISVDVPAAGFYALSVYKRGPSDLPLDGSYALNFDPTVTGIDTPGVIHSSGLSSVHPNPFNPRTTISFRLDREQKVTLDVYNLRGERVRRILDEVRSSGEHDVVWNGRDDSGHSVASGAYVVRMVAGSVQDVRKVMLVQ